MPDGWAQVRAKLVTGPLGKWLNMDPESDEWCEWEDRVPKCHITPEVWQTMFVLVQRTVLQLVELWELFQQCCIDAPRSTARLLNHSTTTDSAAWGWEVAQVLSLMQANKRRVALPLSCPC